MKLNDRNIPFLRLGVKDYVVDKTYGAVIPYSGQWGEPNTLELDVVELAQLAESVECLCKLVAKGRGIDNIKKL